MFGLKERKFLMVDFQWLHDWYHSSDTHNSWQTHENLRKFFSLEDLIFLCMEDPDLKFVDERIQPAVEVNVLTTDQEQTLYEFVKAIYTNIHMRLESTLDFDEKLIPTPENNNRYNLVGFFGTTAIIGLGEIEEYTEYPTFKESYGSFGTEKWRSEICANPVLQTVAPIIDGECKPPIRF